MVDNNYGGHVLFIIYYTFTTINQQNELPPRPPPPTNTTPSRITRHLTKWGWYKEPTEA